MSGLTTGFHPSFDALSAHADRNDVEAARTRVARHVARCDQCRAEVRDIRALGEAARAMSVPAAPGWLKARIESAVPHAEETSPAETFARTTRVGSPGSTTSTIARGAGG